MDKAQERREIWVDNVKTAACILVVLGHFFQSMVQSGILEETDVWKWFDQTIYCFHVQLFFICSGYLYQKGRNIRSFKDWKANTIKKAIALGVPYFTFSGITWIMKNVFSWAVNNEEPGILVSFFVEPISPYWYLYTLFWAFVITPVLTNKKNTAVIFVTACFMKLFVMSNAAAYLGVPYVLRNQFNYEIWFVFGMLLYMAKEKQVKTCEIKKRYLITGSTLGILFLGTSIVIFMMDLYNSWIEFLLGTVACGAIVSMEAGLWWENTQIPFLETAARYTMPIFLMHTIFAAGLRSILVKMGIYDPFIHVTAGILFSFLGPAAAMKIMEKLKWPVFFVYPLKVLRRR